MMRNFSKSNATALAATVVDFGTLTFLVEVMKVHYVVATAIGAVGGALLNFALNRKWAFSDWKGSSALPARKHFAKQAKRYALCSAVSAIFNTIGVFFFAHFIGLQYLGAKVVTAITVAWIWNYPMHRYYVWPKHTGATSL